MRSRLTRNLLLGAVLGVASVAQAAAEEQRAVVFGHIGGAGLGHADSEQGKAPIFGGGIAFHLTPRLIVDGDVHGAHVSHVFGQDHDFTETTFTASVLFRSSPDARAHFLAGGGLGVQRAHTEFNDVVVGHVDRVETVRLLHGRAGAEWDLSPRVMLRTEGVLWFGQGLDWVTGARVAVGYRF